MVVDYYAMLGADPRADRSSLEAALARCQPTWSSGTRNPKTKHTYQSYLDQIPEIRRTLLGDPGVRSAYDAELDAARRALRDQKLDELQRLVKLRAAKGGLTVADRSMLREQAELLDLDPSDLDRLIEPIPPKPEAPTEIDAFEPAPDVLDGVTRKQIRVALDHLRRLDLYDALSLVRDAPAIEIAARADSERRRWMQKTQVTAEKTAWLEVVSHAQSHLGSTEARARYDRTLALEAEERLASSIAFAVKGLAKLDYGTRSVLIDEATRQGITSERADVLISRGCRALGVTRDGAPALILSNTIEPPRYLRCRACSGVTEFADVSSPPARPECRHCRASLQWTCPACKKVRWVDEPRCVCGFPLENLEPLHRHFEFAQQAHRARDYPMALDHLNRVLNYASNHAGAKKGIDTVRRHMAQAETARSAFEQARAQRRLVAARAAVLAWARLVPADSPEVVAAREEVDRGLRMAQSLAAKGKAAEDDTKAARAFYEKALGISADLDDAREGLRRCPPDPPSALVAEFDVDRVRLRWTPPPLDGLGTLKFRVVRKRAGIPTQPNDGAVVAEVLEAEAEDRKVKPGESVGYAVFSVRGETSSKSAPTAGPFTVLPEVLNLRVEARSGEVALGWTLPDHASGVRVVRNLNHRPAHDRDGEILTALPTGLIDRNLVDDRPYHYAIYALYPGPDGLEQSSKGLSALAVPHPPVEAPLAPVLSPGLEGLVRLAWPTPPRGSIKIIRTSKSLPLNPGDRVPAPSTAEWPGDWIDAPLPGRAEDPSPPPIGVCFYTPILEWAGMATIGFPARYSCVADPSELRAVRVGTAGKVHLRWAWSPQATESLVVAKSGSAPTGADDPEAITSTVSDERYSRLRFFEIQLPTGIPGPWHVAVFSVATVQGERVVSPGLEPSARTVVPGPNPEVTVSYLLRRPRFPARTWTLSFRTEPADSPIPPTALVTLPQTVPLSAVDGEIVARFPATRDGESFTIPSNIDLTRQRARIFVDPHADPDGLPPIRLRHPEGDTARI
jgi:tetratricopeptide (TPR) repeat protein